MLQQNPILKELQQFKGLQPDSGVRENPANNAQPRDSRSDTERRFEQTMAATRQQAERQELRQTELRQTELRQTEQRQSAEREASQRREEQRQQALRAESTPRTQSREEQPQTGPTDRKVNKNKQTEAHNAQASASNHKERADKGTGQDTKKSDSTNGETRKSNASEVKADSQKSEVETTDTNKSNTVLSSEVVDSQQSNNGDKVETLTELMTKIAALLSELQGEKSGSQDTSLSLEAIINKMNQAGIQATNESNQDKDLSPSDLMLKLNSLLQALLGNTDLEGNKQVSDSTSQVQAGEWDFEQTVKTQLTGAELKQALATLSDLKDAFSQELLANAGALELSTNTDGSLQEELESILDSLNLVLQKLTPNESLQTVDKTQANEDTKALSWLTSVMSQAELSRQGSSTLNSEIASTKEGKAQINTDSQFSFNPVSSALLKEANNEAKATQNNSSLEDSALLKTTTDSESQSKLGQILTPTKPIQLNGGQTQLNGAVQGITNSEVTNAKVELEGKFSAENLNEIKAAEVNKTPEAELKSSNLKTLLESGFLQSEKPPTSATKLSTVEVAGVQLDRTLQAPKLEHIVQTKNDVVIKENILFNKQELANNIQTQVGLMMARNMKSVDIRLDPPELGSIQVKLSLGEQANVSFVVSTQQAKDALEDSLPKLREMLEKQGMELGNSDVSKDDSNGQPADDDEPNTGHFAEQSSEQEQSEADESKLAAQIASPWQVDYYA